MHYQKIKEHNEKSNYNFSESKALKLAKNELTKKYMNNYSFNDYTYLNIHVTIKDIIVKDNKKYYYIIATSGDISGNDNGTLWDGEINKEKLKELQCLIDVDNGDYINITKKFIE